MPVHIHIWVKYKCTDKFITCDECHFAIMPQKINKNKLINKKNAMKPSLVFRHNPNMNVPVVVVMAEFRRVISGHFIHKEIRDSVLNAHCICKEKYERCRIYGRIFEYVVEQLQW